MAERVRTAVFPVAGLGTRFLPATKAMPKEMLTVVDRPLIQYAVDEAREAGIEHFVFVTGRNKGVIEDHFDKPVRARAHPRDARQDRRAGRAAARPAAGRPGAASPASRSRSASATPSGAPASSSATSPSRCCCPTCCSRPTPGVLKQMMEAYEERGGNIIAVEEVEPSEVSSYGVVGRGEGPDTGFRHHRHGGKAQGRRRALQPHHLRPLHPPARDLPAARRKACAAPAARSRSPTPCRRLMRAQAFTGVKYEGRSFDCGSKIGFLTANVVFALDRPDIADAFLAEIQELAQRKPQGR